MISLLGLIQMYNTYAHNNVYHDVAKCILNHYTKIDEMTTNEIADLCCVSPSTLHRFFRMMAFPMTVSKLPQLVGKTKDNYMFDGYYLPFGTKEKGEHAIDLYVETLMEQMAEVKKNISYDTIRAITEDIKNAKNVVFVGSPIPQSVWRFQMDLVLKGIETSAFLDPNYQYEIKNIKKNTVVFYL
ncbi:MAG TPA: hypothetical protein DHN33_10250 [Eubacteriaceae bacterium]|nr:hypothetical protein [Eubacteriaceae bacterium]